jgi:hypothetical protein
LIVFGGLCGLAGLLWAGSSLFSGSQPSPSPSPSLPAIEFTPGPTAASAPDPIVEVDIFRDDFSDPSSGWPQEAGAGSSTDYDSGGYRILVDEPNTIYWATPGLNFADVTIEVDAEKIAGAEDNYFGILCRYQDNDNFYLFSISSDGYYSIGKYKNGEFSFIHDNGQGYSNLIHQGKTTNRLRIDCEGTTLTLYANDSKLATVEDADFTSGDIGLMAAAFDIAGTNILFDNFVAEAP